jgi:hypothetical protein
MKKLDEQILEVENRIARRRMAVELTTRAVWHRSVARLTSPVSLAGAAALGFVAVAAVFRRRPKIVERRTSARAPKWGSLLGLAASGAFTLLRSQYGGPVQMANALAQKIRALRQGKNTPRAVKNAPHRGAAVVH